MAQSFANFKETDAEFLAPLYGKGDLNLVAGLGTYLQDASGKRYLDFVSGIAVNALGHCHPSVVAAIRRQAEDFIHISNLYPNKPQLELAKRIVEVSDYSKVFFCNSGTEANEGAIKFARKFFNRNGKPEKQKIVTFLNSFHGRTLTTLSATGQEHYHELFNPLTPGFVHTPANDINALKSIIESHKVFQRAAASAAY